MDVEIPSRWHHVTVAAGLPAVSAAGLIARMMGL